MAHTDGTTSRRLAFLKALQERPYAAGLFQALRRVDCLDPRRPPLGESTQAAQDPVRLGQHPSLGFAPAEIHSFEPARGGRPPRLNVFSFGLFGPNGPLPLHLTEWAQDRLRRHDRTFTRFVDLFHHRMLSLFYRAWANGEPTVNLDRPDRDRFQIYVGSLFGFGSPSMRGRDEAPDFARLFFAGRFASQPRNAEGLGDVAAAYLGMNVQVREFIGEWVEMPADEQWRLGSDGRTGRLGESANLGSRVWDLQQKFRLVVGPISLAEYESLLPGKSTFASLAALVRSYAGYEMEWDVNVVLAKEEIPRMQLGTGTRLGWTSWLSGSVPERDAADPVLDPQVMENRAGGSADAPAEAAIREEALLGSPGR